MIMKESLIREEEEEREKKEPFKERSGIFVKARRGNEREGGRKLVAR